MTDNPIRKQRKVIIRSPWESWGMQIRSERWHAICPSCGGEVDVLRAPHGDTRRSTRKQAKDALYHHMRSHEPGSVDTATTCNA